MQTELVEHKRNYELRAVKSYQSKSMSGCLAPPCDVGPCTVCIAVLARGGAASTGMGGGGGLGGCGCICAESAIALSDAKGSPDPDPADTIPPRPPPPPLPILAKFCPVCAPRGKPGPLPDASDWPSIGPEPKPNPLPPYCVLPWCAVRVCCVLCAPELPSCNDSPPNKSSAAAPAVEAPLVPPIAIPPS